MAQFLPLMLDWHNADPLSKLLIYGHENTTQPHLITQPLLLATLWVLPVSLGDNDLTVKFCSCPMMC